MMRRLRDHLLNVLAPLAMVIVLLVPSLSAQMGVDLFTAGEKTQRVRPMDEQPLLFLQAVNFDAGGSDASSLAVADVNGDGKPDIIAANHSSNSVAVLLGNGDGTFEPAVAYPSGGVMPGAVAVADLNSDGNLDIAVVNWWASSGKNVDPTAVIGVLLGNGDGTYQPAVVLRLSGVYGSSLAVADLNGDGKADLVVTRTASRTNWDGVVSVLLGNGDGTFRPEVAYNSGGQGDSLPLAVGDVNGDNKADLLVWNAGTGSLGVLLGNGDGTFRPVATYATAGGGLTLADVNRDGKLDLVVAGGSVLVLLGNGDGTFQPAVAYEPGGASATSLAVADVDGDGKPDLVVANYCDDYNYCFYGVVGVLIGNGDGTFQPPTAYFSGGHFALATAASDVNCDGAPDTIVGNGDSAAVLLNNRGAPSTTTTLVSKRNPVLVKQAVTYTAAVTTQSGETPEGTVLFRDYSTPPWMRLATVPLAGGQAAYSTTYARNSTHSITATYSGDLHHDAGSRSATLTE